MVPNAGNKTLPSVCPAGKPFQFYDNSYLIKAREEGLLPSLRIKSRYPHELPTLGA